MPLLDAPSSRRTSPGVDGLRAAEAPATAPIAAVTTGENPGVVHITRLKGFAAHPATCAEVSPPERAFGQEVRTFGDPWMARTDYIVSTMPHGQSARSRRGHQGVLP